MTWKATNKRTSLISKRPNIRKKSPTTYGGAFFFAPFTTLTTTKCYQWESVRVCQANLMNRLTTTASVYVFLRFDYNKGKSK